eukprot:scaffold130559_cov22-Tisochrysis_lutea.AAC.1
MVYYMVAVYFPTYYLVYAACSWEQGISRGFFAPEMVVALVDAHGKHAWLNPGHGIFASSTKHWHSVATTYTYEAKSASELCKQQCFRERFAGWTTLFITGSPWSNSRCLWACSKGMHFWSPVITEGDPHFSGAP